MAELRELSVNQFVEATASTASVPGGGSVSAMVGALGAALMEMVANLTIGKEKYAGVQEEMQALAAEGAALHEELLAGIKKDSESFNGYMRALKLPKETEEEKIYHLRGSAIPGDGKDLDEDANAVAEGYVSVSPISVDRTDYQLLADLRQRL